MNFLTFFYWLVFSVGLITLSIFCYRLYRKCTQHVRMAMEKHQKDWEKQYNSLVSAMVRNVPEPDTPLLSDEDRHYAWLDAAKEIKEGTGLE
jgi:hypothetical protein